MDAVEIVRVALVERLADVLVGLAGEFQAQPVVLDALSPEIVELGFGLRPRRLLAVELVALVLREIEAFGQEAARVGDAFANALLVLGVVIIVGARRDGVMRFRPRLPQDTATLMLSAPAFAATPVTAASPPVEKSTRAPEESLPKTSSPDRQEKLKNEMFDVGKRAYDRADWLKAVSSLRPLAEIGDVVASDLPLGDEIVIAGHEAVVGVPLG